MIANCGWISLMRRWYSNHNPLRLPDKPAPRPTALMSWQGNPPAMTLTCSFISLAFSLVTSSKIGTSGQCVLRTERQKGSISQKATVRIPARSRPRLNPPMPEKRSRTFMGCFRYSRAPAGGGPLAPAFTPPYALRRRRRESAGASSDAASAASGSGAAPSIPTHSIISKTGV